MINIRTIYIDLKENIRAEYQTSQITIVNFLLFSLKNDSVKSFLNKYKTNENDLAKGLNTLIVKNNETEPKQKIGFIQDQRKTALDSLAFLQGKKDEVKADVLFEQLITLANEKSIEQINLISEKKGRQIVFEKAMVTFESLLYVISQDKSKVCQSIMACLVESKFDKEKFISDFVNGEQEETSVIKDFCVDLVEQARNGKFQEVIGRENEILQIANILAKARKNNPILNGKAGVGKTAIVEGLAKLIAEKKVHPKLQNAVIYSLEVSKLLSGANMKGQYEERVQNLLKEIKEIEDKGEIFPILFIDEIHTIMGAGGGSGSVDFSNAIKPALARGDLRTIGATTTDEWYKFIKNDPALDRRFISVYIAEPSFKDAVSIITKTLPYYEKEHQIKYNEDVPARAVELSSQFIVDNSQPDKSFDLIDFAGAMASLNGKTEVSVDDVEIALSKQKNIDLSTIESTRKNNFAPIYPMLKKEIFGQDDVLKKISDRLELMVAGLTDASKPQACFFFVGPENVGKTLTVHQISKIMKFKLFRLDMNEYSDSSSINKLLGSPVGYIGSEDGSLLSKLINENPRCIVQFDNIGNAAKSIIHLIEQIIDNGYINDAKGKEINFKNVIIILSQNKTSEKPLELPSSLMNRITFNKVLEFKSLNDEILMKVTEKELSKINEYLVTKNIKIEFSTKLIEQIVNKDKKEKLGVTGLKNLIEEAVMTQLKDKILFGDLKNNKEMRTMKLFFENELFVIR